MALSVPSEVIVFKEEQSIGENPSLPTTTTGQERYELERWPRLEPDPSIDTGSMFVLGEHLLPLRDYNEKVELAEFNFNKPWLPPQVFDLLNKAKIKPLSEKELMRLMDLVAERASVHFQLTGGEFVAMTFHGQIIEVSETRAGLLKKIQSRKHSEEIFVWRIGSATFSGRI